jgi:mannobiose 2-epimerase
MTDKLYDKKHKGFSWGTDYTGTTPILERKVIYGQAFAIYALSEYARSGGPPKALELAFETYELLQRSAADPRHGGYFEACARDWSATVNSALSDFDIACDKSMNTNLHVMEALSALYAASGDKGVLEALRGMIDIHIGKILASTGHLGLYFKADWTRMDGIVSYGHDIEASWLISEAAGHAWKDGLPARVRERVLEIAAGTARALDENEGTLPNELREGRLEPERIWWVQAEAMVGMVNAWELGGDARFLDRAAALWTFIKKHLIDRVHGEWLWSVHPDGKPVKGRPKGGFWKTAYHDGRACMEIMERAARAEKGPASR